MPDNSNYQFRAVPLDLIQYVMKKQKSAKYYFRYLLDRTIMMFEYKNLPDSIDSHVLERYLQVNGVACIGRADDGNLYAFNGSWGGIQDVYYRPTKFIVSNPHISQLNDGTGHSFTKEFTIYGTQEHDAVLMRNDTEWASLTPLIARYAVLMCENCITVRQATIMLRCLALLSGSNDKEYKSALAFLSKLEAGELGAVSESSFSDGIKMQSPPSNNGSYLTQFIELQQYLKGSFFNELGLRANYNMKREAIGQGESTLDADSILPLCDNMLKCRREDICEINNMFNLDISVDFSSAWLENHLESSINIISQLNEAGVTTPGGQVSGELGQLGSSSNDSDNSNISGGDINGNGTGIEENGSVDGKGGTVGEAGSDTGSISERSGVETSDAGESGQGESGNSGEPGESNEDSADNSGGDAGRTEEEEEERREDQEKIAEVKRELTDEDLTFVEGAVEVVNDKISQLIADARKGDLDE